MSAAEVLAQHWPVHDPHGHINGTVPGSVAVYDCFCGEVVNARLDDCLAHQLDALKAAGYEVVKLPEPAGEDDDGQEYFADGDIRVDHTAKGGEHPTVYVSGYPSSPRQIRAAAAEMLASANAAEAQS